MIKGIKLFDKEKTPSLGQFDVPDGKYDFKVVDVKANPPKDESKMPTIGAQCEVQGGTYAGTKIWAFWNLPNEEDPPEHFRRQLWRDIWQACPACTSDNAEGLDEDALKGLTFSATVYHEVYNNVERCRFKSYRFGKGSEKKAATTGNGPSKFSAPPST